MDLACGRGRNAAAARAAVPGPVVGIDRNPAALRALPAGVCGVRADLEAGASIPLRSGSCGVVLVFRFLFRPLGAEIERLLAPGGLLIYETFTRNQAKEPHGPGNPAFLLAGGELPGLFPGLRVAHHEEGPWRDGGQCWHTARLLATKPGGASIH